MLSWLKSLARNQPRVECYPDTIAMREEAALNGLRNAIQQRRPLDPLILVVAHFPSTFFQLQDALTSWNQAYQIPTPPLRPQLVPLGASDGAPGELLLVLSEMLEVETGLNVADQSRSISVMVAERHLLPSYDRRIESFARQLPHPAKVGYFLSLDAPAVAPLAGSWAIELLRLWGMSDADLITSELVTRRLARARQWLEKEVTAEISTDSPREWLEQNGKHTRFARSIAEYLSQPPVRPKRR